MFDGAILFSNGKSEGNAGAVGSVLKITNISDKVYPFSLRKNEPIASGICLNSCNPCYDYKRILLKEAPVPTNKPLFSFYIPGVFDESSICSVIDFLPTSFYISISKKDCIRFMIHKKKDIVAAPDSDPILDVITADDQVKYQLVQLGRTSDYLIRRRYQIFEEKYQAIAGENPVIGKRYPIPVRCSVDITI